MEEIRFSSVNLEKVELATFAKGEQLLSFAAAEHHSGVTSFTNALASRSAEMGKGVLLVEFNNRLTAKTWNTSQPLKQGLYMEEAGYCALNVTAFHEELLRWSDAEFVSSFLNLLKRHFERVILDLPPIFVRDFNEVSPLTLAHFSDSLSLILKSGETTSTDSIEILNILHGASIKCAGLILNDRDYPTLGKEFARQAEKIEKFLPNKAKIWSDKFRNSDFLNVHI